MQVDPQPVMVRLVVDSDQQRVHVVLQLAEVATARLLQSLAPSHSGSGSRGQEEHAQF